MCVRKSSGNEDTGNLFSRCLGLIRMVINLNVDYCSSAGGLTRSMSRRFSSIFGLPVLCHLSGASCCFFENEGNILLFYFIFYF